MKRGRKAHCIHCGSKQTISKGYRPTATLGRRSLRVCKDCGRKFTVGRLNVVKSISPMTATLDEATPAAPLTYPSPTMPASEQGSVSAGP